MYQPKDENMVGLCIFFPRWLTFDLRRFEYALFHRGCWVKCYAYGSISRCTDQLASRPQTHCFGGFVSFLVDEGVKKHTSQVIRSDLFIGHLTRSLNHPKKITRSQASKNLRHIVVATTKLGGGFKYVFLMFTPVWGRFPVWLKFFKGLKPPTRKNIQHPAGHHRNPLHLLNAWFWGWMEISSLKLFLEDFFACFYKRW